MSTVKTPEEIYNIINNLNSLENYLLSQSKDSGTFENVETYMGFLEQHFIKKNNFAQLYFQQIPGDIHGTWKTLKHIEEIYAIISGMDIAVYKQFNFPNYKMHSEGCYECVYIMKGAANLQLSSNVYLLTEGDFIFHQPKEEYLLITEPDSIVLNIELRTSYIHDYYQSLFSGCSPALLFFQICYNHEAEHNYLLFHTDNSYKIQEIFLHMLGEMLSDNLYKNDIMRHYFGLFICYLKRHSGNQAETIRKLSAKERYYNDIMQYLQVNYRTTDLETTASQFHLSKNYVSRIVQSIGDRSFVEMLTLIRIDKAKEYLAETTLVLDDIAELVGFSDASYLWRKFKKQTGISPSQYREQTSG